MSRYYSDTSNGYAMTLRKGMETLRRISRNISYGKGTKAGQTERLRMALSRTPTIVIGGGAGLSTAAGLTYSGARFETYFSDFIQAFGIQDMYSGGFYPFPDDETRWAWWARHIYFNRYIDPPKAVYPQLLELVRDKDYFVITTNVDHQFQRAHWDKSRLFYTQGDYGLFQSVNPQHAVTWDNADWVMEAMEAQGFVRGEDGVFQLPADGQLSMRIPTALIPTSPADGSPVTMNLRADETFVEDEGWHRASAAYAAFLRQHARGPVLYLELGVGGNTPGIIKYPFWAMTLENPEAIYACVNYDEAFCPVEIEARSICIKGDIAPLVQDLLENPWTD